MTSHIAQALIDNLLARVDGSGSDEEWKAINELRSRMGDELPDQLLGLYKKSKKWKVRSSCVYHSVRYARTSKAAIDLALLAVRDKSQVVRYRACMLLAYSQIKELLPILKLLLDAVDDSTKVDVRAAIDAIAFENQNFFVDRDHSGMTTLNIL